LQRLALKVKKHKQKTPMATTTTHNNNNNKSNNKSKNPTASSGYQEAGPFGLVGSIFAMQHHHGKQRGPHDLLPGRILQKPTTWHGKTTGRQTKQDSQVQGR
jgi:hypothetical protein